MQSKLYEFTRTNPIVAPARRRLLARYGWILLLAVFVTVAVVLSYRQRPPQDSGHTGVAAQVEEVNLSSLKARLADLEGKVVLVNLWATW